MSVLQASIPAVIVLLYSATFICEDLICLQTIRFAGYFIINLISLGLVMVWSLPDLMASVLAFGWTIGSRSWWVRCYSFASWLVPGYALSETILEELFENSVAQLDDTQHEMKWTWSVGSVLVGYFLILTVWVATLHGIIDGGVIDALSVIKPNGALECYISAVAIVALYLPANYFGSRTMTVQGNLMDAVIEAGVRSTLAEAA